MSDHMKLLVYRVAHSGALDKRQAEGELTEIHERILAVAGRGLDNDGDNKAGAQSMRAALNQIVELLAPEQESRSE